MSKFDRVRSFLVIHSVFAIVCPVFRRVRVRSSSSQFDRLRSSSTPNIPIRRAEKRKLSDSSCFSTYHSLITTLCRFGPLADSSFFSVLRKSGHSENRCQSSREFARLRPFLVFHRVFDTIPHFSAVKKFARLHLSSREFALVRSSSLLVNPPRRAVPSSSLIASSNSLHTTF